MSTWEERTAKRGRTRSTAVTARVEEPGPTRETVLADLAPGVDTEHCAHGITYGRGGFGALEEPIAWAGGVAFCECCRSHYGFVDMVIYDGRRGWHGHATDRHLCHDCGGQVREFSERKP